MNGQRDLRDHEGRCLRMCIDHKRFRAFKFLANAKFETTHSFLCAHVLRMWAMPDRRIVTLNLHRPELPIPSFPILERNVLNNVEHERF